MPFTRISLLKGRTKEEIASISDILQRALVEAFDVPPGDCFQAFHQHDAGELVFDRDYAGGPRSDGYILFQVTAGRPRSTETKKAFYRRLVELLGAAAVRPEDVMVIITTTGMEDWSFASGGTQLLDTFGPKAGQGDAA